MRRWLTFARNSSVTTARARLPAFWPLRGVEEEGEDEGDEEEEDEFTGDMGEGECDGENGGENESGRSGAEGLTYLTVRRRPLVAAVFPAAISLESRALAYSSARATARMSQRQFGQ